MGRKIASQWTTDPDAAGSSLEAGTAQEEDKGDSQGTESPELDSEVLTACCPYNCSGMGFEAGNALESMQSPDHAALHALRLVPCVRNQDQCL